MAERDGELRGQSSLVWEWRRLRAVLYWTDEEERAREEEGAEFHEGGCIVELETPRATGGVSFDGVEEVEGIGGH